MSRSGLTSSILSDKYTNLVQISNQPVVIIEVGRSLTKLGFSGEDAPRSIIKTPFNLFQSRQKTANFLRTCYKSELKTSPQKHKLVILEDVTADRKNLEKLVQSCFIDIRVPVICIVPAFSMVPYSTGLIDKSSLIIDIGAKETVICPILSGNSIEQKCLQFSEIGTDFLVKNLRENYPELSFEQAEEIVVRSCFSSKDRLAGKDIEIRISGSECVSIKGEHRQVFGLFFDDENSLAEKIKKCISKAPVDYRKCLMENICIVGGGANIVGLKGSIYQELNLGKSTNYGIVEPHCNGNIAAWVGASLFSQVKYNLDKLSLLRDAYVKYAYNGGEDLVVSDVPQSSHHNTSEDLTDQQMLEITQKMHLHDDNFLPMETILPDLYRNPEEVNKIDELCLTLAQVMEAKRRPMRGGVNLSGVGSGSLSGSLGGNLSGLGSFGGAGDSRHRGSSSGIENKLSSRFNLKSDNKQKSSDSNLSTSQRNQRVQDLKDRIAKRRAEEASKKAEV